MARRGPAHHKSAKQKRSVQAAVRASVRVEQHYPDVVQRIDAVREPSTVLAPVPYGYPHVGESDAGQAAWVYRGTFLHITKSTKHEQRVLVYCDRAALWSSGQAMAKKGVAKFFDQRLQRERPPGHLSDFALLGVVCEGQYDFVMNTIHPENAEGYR